jgi:hypothetical protein
MTTFVSTTSLSGGSISSRRQAQLDDEGSVSKISLGYNPPFTFFQQVGQVIA